MDLKKLLELVGDELTPTQREHVQAVIDADGNKSAAAVNVDRSRSAIRQSIKFAMKKAANRGYSPDHDMTKTTPKPFRVKGTSTYYDADGDMKAQWVKTERDAAAFLEEIKDTIHELTDTLPHIPPREFTGTAYAKLHAVYPLGDPHVGMLSYGKETGQDWDLQIAESKFLPVFDRLVKAAPPCDEATILDLGDFWHSDNIEGKTSRSGHKVDMDGRFSKMIKVGYRILRRMIESALDHHRIVRVIILPGNHDDVGSLFLRESLIHIYENEPRVIVNPSISVFQYFVWGKNLVGCHHGHTCKLPQLPLVMASDMAREWGSSQHRYWYTGHIHHDSKKEYAGCIVESFRTLAGPEAYSIEAGYRTGQDSKCIVLHKDHGEIERHTVDIERVDD